MDTHFDVKAPNRRQSHRRGTKWSGRRTIGFAILASVILWIMIFSLVKAFLV